MLVLFPGFIFTPRAVHSYHLTGRIGGCGVGDFAVLGTVDLNVMHCDFHYVYFFRIFIHIMLDMYTFYPLCSL